MFSLQSPSNWKDLSIKVPKSFSYILNTLRDFEGKLDTPWDFKKLKAQYVKICTIFSISPKGF